MDSESIQPYPGRKSMPCRLVFAMIDSSSQSRAFILPCGRRESWMTRAWPQPVILGQYAIPIGTLFTSSQTLTEAWLRVRMRVPATPCMGQLGVSCYQGGLSMKNNGITRVKGLDPCATLQLLRILSFSRVFDSFKRPNFNCSKALSLDARKKMHHLQDAGLQLPRSTCDRSGPGTDLVDAHQSIASLPVSCLSKDRCRLRSPRQRIPTLCGSVGRRAGNGAERGWTKKYLSS